MELKPNPRACYPGAPCGIPSCVVCNAAPIPNFFARVLEYTEVAIIVVDEMARARYCNFSARRLLQVRSVFPAEFSDNLRPLLDRATETAEPVVARLSLYSNTIRVRVRPMLEAPLFSVEVRVVLAGDDEDAGVLLIRALEIRVNDSQLLVLMWRGLTNNEIAARLDIPVGTVKSRSNWLFRRLGVRNRTEAALLAAEVLGSPTTQKGS